MTMSNPERSRGTTRSGASRLRPLALAGVVVALTATGCANYEVLQPYQPASGVQTNAPGIQVRNLMVVDGGGSAKLAGTLISQSADQLVGVTGTTRKDDGSQGQALKIAADKVALPAHTAVALEKGDTTVSGATAGGMTNLTLTFAKSGPITLTVPVVSSTSMDVSTQAPEAAASNAG